jgi:hypothetical protein
MIEPLYRYLIHNVDVIQKDDQYFNTTNRKWETINDISYGKLYDSGRYYPFRRLDVRTINLRELLNDTMIKPIYRNLVNNVDIIKKGDQYYNLDTESWDKINDTAIGETYNTSKYYPIRRINMRIMNLKELLNVKD